MRSTTPHAETEITYRNRLARILNTHGACRFFFRACVQLASDRVQAVQMCSMAVRSGSAFDQQTAQSNTKIGKQYQRGSRAMAGRDTVPKRI